MTETPNTDAWADLRHAVAHVTAFLNGTLDPDEISWSLRRIEEDTPVLLERLTAESQRADRAEVNWDQARRHLEIAQRELATVRALAASIKRLTDYPSTSDAYPAEVAKTLRHTAGQLDAALNGGPVPTPVETAEQVRARIAADCARRAGYYDHPEIWLPESQSPDAIAARAMQQAWATAARLIRSGEIPADDDADATNGGEEL